MRCLTSVHINKINKKTSKLIKLMPASWMSNLPQNNNTQLRWLKTKTCNQLTCSGISLAKLWQLLQDLSGWPLWPSLANFVLQVSQHVLKFVRHRKVAVLGQSAEGKIFKYKSKMSSMFIPLSFSPLWQPMQISPAAFVIFLVSKHVGGNRSPNSELRVWMYKSLYGV